MTPSGGSNEIIEASEALAQCLRSRNDIKWALVGGACLTALGSQRQTEDVDVVIAPSNLLRDAKNTLRSDARFAIDPRTRHTTFAASSGILIEIQFLSYPGTFKTYFGPDTHTISSLVSSSSDVSCLNLASLLDSKCASIISRSNDDKRVSDGFDITFLLKRLISQEQTLDASLVPNANQEFQAWFSTIYPDALASFQALGL